MSESGTYQSYSLTYCESCGQIEDGTDPLVDRLEEPVHRVDILEELGGVTDEQTHETTALEQGNCQGCSGQIVQRYYAVGEVPEPEVDVEDYETSGRDPEDDALVELPERGWQERDEVPSLTEESSDE